ncbi:MAG TPA: PIG-L family deacetylase [Firmicutes bacterium]|nr:PIG-L family deacetylase [Bacillota bacterium]
MINFVNKGAEIFVPDGAPADEALRRTTHMAIAAHQDDVEIMGADGFLKCFGNPDQWFTAVVVTNGAGSPRADLYADYTDEMMMAVRKKEQKKAAYIGEYSAAVLLDYSSSGVKNPANTAVVGEIKELLNIARPEVVYTHNLADKHDTHVGVALRVIKAIRELPKEARPKKIYGCEVWRSLDWVLDNEKTIFDVSAHPNMTSALVSIYDSQVCGGKRYDLATIGRRTANATYAESHGTDTATAYIYAIDLTPLIEDDNLCPKELIEGYIERFKAEVAKRLDSLS